jgi:hypothetical protein
LRLLAAGANRGSAAEQKVERAAESIGREAKWQARNFDPGMEAAKAVAVAGEGKAVTSIRSRLGESCGARGSIDPVVAKSAAGERKGDAPGAPGCNVQYRACRW